MSGAQPDPSRRKLMRSAAGAVAGGAILLAGCGGSSSSSPQIHVKAVLGVPPGDVPLLTRLLDLEHLAIAAYTAGTPLFESYWEQKAAEQFLDQELAHSGEIAGLIRKGGAKPGRPKESYDLGHPRTRGELLTLLHRIEREQIAAYLYAIPRVSGNAVRPALGAILGNEAQHMAIIRAYQRQSPAPAAFVTGRE
ncbi:MAG: ferritin-like domain-containing protein [Solirubrobacterales bacterium]|nr:ferritin-like domain-containing protein [Solirubrobacterales bacterium]